MKHLPGSIIVMTLLLIFVTLDGKAQNEPSKDVTKAKDVRHNLTFQHTTLVVSDFSVSKEFYLGLLQLEEMEADWLPENQMFVSLGNNLELHVGEVEGVEINPSSFNHFAMSTEDLDGFLLYLKENGIVYSGLGGGDKYEVFERPDGVRQTFFQDPDGYWLEVNDATDEKRILR